MIRRRSSTIERGSGIACAAAHPQPGGWLAYLQEWVEAAEFDTEFLPPTPEALGAAERLLSSLEMNRGDLARMRPALSASGDGSLDLSWRQGAREVRVLAPPTPAIPVRLYYREGVADGVDGVVTPETLARRLDWVSAG